MKVLHVLYQSLPDCQGSSIRSRDIVASQKAIGLDPVVITSPFQTPANAASNPETIEGVKYYRTHQGNSREAITEIKTNLPIKVKKLWRILRFSRQVYETAKCEKADLLHGHGIFFCGLSALIAGNLLKIPVLYEVRSLWEERKLRSDTSLITKAQVILIRFLETLSMHFAHEVIIINHNLKENIKKRGINNHNIKVIPNAVNLNNIPEQLPSLISKRKEEITFGYIGTISPIEGLGYLIEVFDRLRDKGFSNHLLIYGQGIALPELERLIEQKRMSNIQLMGILPPDQIISAYQNIDVIVNPRSRSSLTDTVTPLKPLEAMGYRKLVIASDVGGMRELITDGKTGLLFEADNIDALESLIQSILTKKATGELERIIEHGYEYVKKHKSWNANALRYKDIYNKLIVRAAN